MERALSRAMRWILCACFAVVSCAAPDLPPLEDDTTCSIPEQSRLGNKLFGGVAWSEGCSQKNPNQDLYRLNVIQHYYESAWSILENFDFLFWEKRDHSSPFMPILCPFNSIHIMSIPSQSCICLHFFVSFWFFLQFLIVFAACFYCTIRIQPDRYLWLL